MKAEQIMERLKNDNGDDDYGGFGVKQYNVMDLDPKDMPAFLNELASEYFQDNFDVRMQLSQCSLYIHTINSSLNKKSHNKGDTI